jgi:tetratricopeptide (TPR) repeat protein
MTEDEAVRVLGGDDADAAARAANALWEMWHASGVPEIDKILQRGIEAMERGDLLAAEALFTDIIRRAPDYAEGWNKRATLHWLRGELGESLSDIDRTLALEPRHFGALSGLAMIREAQGRPFEALEALEKLLHIHPRLPHLRDRIEALSARLGQAI